MRSIGDVLNTNIAETLAALAVLSAPSREAAAAARAKHGYGPDVCPYCGDTGRPADNPTGYCRCDYGKTSLCNDENRAAAERVWQRTGVPRRYQDARLSRSDDTAAVAAITSWLREGLALDDGANLLITGGVGAGKTWMACAALRGLHDAGIRPLVFANTLDVLRACRYGPQGDPAAVARYKAAHVLVLDDLGVERDSEFAVEQLYDLIDARYGAMKPTIVTINLDLAGLRSYLGDRIADRLTDIVTVVTVGG